MQEIALELFSFKTNLPFLIPSRSAREHSRLNFRMDFRQRFAFAYNPFAILTTENEGIYMPIETINSTQADSNVCTFNFKTLRQIQAEPEPEVTFLVDGLLPMRGTSILAGKPKVGKSHLVRQIAAAVASNTTFLGRTTQSGEVLYFASEEMAHFISSHFDALGLENISDRIRISTTRRVSDAVQQLRRSLEIFPETKLVIIDPLVQFLPFRDGNDYAKVYEQLSPLTDVARSHDIHLMAVHHEGKRERDNRQDQMMGSTAFAGSFDTLLSLDKSDTQTRTIAVEMRNAPDIPATLLTWDPRARSFSLGATVVESEEERSAQGRESLRNRIFGYLAEHPDLSRSELSRRVRVKAEHFSRAFADLLERGEILPSGGTGRAGSAFTYRVREVPQEEPQMIVPHAPLVGGTE